MLLVDHPPNTAFTTGVNAFAEPPSAPERKFQRGGERHAMPWR